MSTWCSGKPIVFQRHGRRDVTASFDGGRFSSDGGALLLREADNVFGVTGRLAECFSDHRGPERHEHELDCLVAQRVMANALAYEGLNDNGQLPDNRVLALAVGRDDVTGVNPVRDRGHPLAGTRSASRTRRRATATKGSPPTCCMARRKDAPSTRTATDCHCDLALYITCGEHVLRCRPRPPHVDASEGAPDELVQIVAQVCEVWPDVRILVRGDSGFCREAVMA